MSTEKMLLFLKIDCSGLKLPFTKGLSFAILNQENSGRPTGLEPAIRQEADPKSAAFTSFATVAILFRYPPRLGFLQEITKRGGVFSIISFLKIVHNFKRA
jgi:hypothetical protein